MARPRAGGCDQHEAGGGVRGEATRDRAPPAFANGRQRKCASCAAADRRAISPPVCGFPRSYVDHTSIISFLIRSFFFAFSAHACRRACAYPRHPPTNGSQHGRR